MPHPIDYYQIAITEAGNAAVLAYQLRELLALVETSDSLDEIRAQAELARRSLKQVEAK